MEYNPRVQIIPAKPKQRDKRVAIYARVSSKEQHLDRQLAALKDVDKLFTDKLIDCG